jgi:GNAT superfamily N-acetyltransferase
MSFILRFASLDEMQSIAALIVHSTQSWSFSDEPAEELVAELNFDKDAVTSGRVIVATEAGVPVGMCAWSPAGPGKSAELTHLLANPQRKRTRIASALIEAATRQAIWEGADEFLIQADQFCGVSETSSRQRVCRQPPELSRRAAIRASGELTGRA